MQHGSCRVGCDRCGDFVEEEACNKCGEAAVRVVYSTKEATKKTLD